MSELKQTLADVFWIGGSPCAGKTSISRILADRFGLELYHVDKALEIHAQQLDPTLHRALIKWLSASWNVRWMQPIDSLLEDVISCYQEHFMLILEELRSRHNINRLLVEGTALLPKQVSGLLPTRSNAIWVVPTAEFQKEHYSRRERARAIVEQCEEPEEAFNNWMERDARFARWVQTEAKASGVKSLLVDGKHTIEENAIEVAKHFQLLSNERDY